MTKKDLILIAADSIKNGHLSVVAEKILCLDSDADDGGAGSGNWGHKGRPGKRGGSGKGTGGRQFRSGSKEEGFKRNEEARKARSEGKEVPDPPKPEKQKKANTGGANNPANAGKEKDRVKSKYLSDPNKPVNMIFADLAKNKEETSSYETVMSELKEGTMIAGKQGKEEGNYEKLKNGDFMFWPDNSDIDPYTVKASEAATGARAYNDSGFKPEQSNKKPQIVNGMINVESGDTFHASCGYNGAPISIPTFAGNKGLISSLTVSSQKKDGINFPSAACVLPNHYDEYKELSDMISSIREKHKIRGFGSEYQYGRLTGAEQKKVDEAEKRIGQIKAENMVVNIQLNDEKIPGKTEKQKAEMKKMLEDEIYTTWFQGIMAATTFGGDEYMEKFSESMKKMDKTSDELMNWYKQKRKGDKGMIT